ncbi:MAG: hypothetical protein MZV65_40350 [Chromatiales bacterium]|nr:hypothetical protein [Chromatiales bacterium]
MSGPLLDRIDLHIEVPRLAHRVLRGETPEESSATVRARVCAARDRQLQRAGKSNSALNTRQIERYCALGEADHQLAGTGAGTTGAVAARLSPHPESRPHHRRPGRQRRYQDAASDGGDQLPRVGSNPGSLRQSALCIHLFRRKRGCYAL